MKTTTKTKDIKPTEPQAEPPVETANATEPESIPEVLDPEDMPRESETAGTEPKYSEILDRYQRVLAEFDNFRKRTAKEMSVRYNDGIRAAAEKLLPIVDNFERAMNAAEDREDTFYQGIALIARQFDGVLAELGIEIIAAEPGTNFDANLHYAVAHTEDENFGENAVTEVLQKGYTHKDRVLRPAMVKVAN